jgi:hypothetical protein
MRTAAVPAIVASRLELSTRKHHRLFAPASAHALVAMAEPRKPIGLDSPDGLRP